MRVVLQSMVSSPILSYFSDKGPFTEKISGAPIILFTPLFTMKILKII